MGDPRGFLQLGRQKPPARPVADRRQDFREFEEPLGGKEVTDQASRCMDCGIPFCHKGCPLGNLIPDFNDHVYRGRWDLAIDALEATNNFPEITGRVCPAPCEASCVLQLHGAPVTIKEIERSIAAKILDRALPARKAAQRRGQSVAVIGSGPAGLATAQELSRKGYDVTVFEKDDRAGGLLRYGIPDFKMEKSILDRRTDQMEREGVRFRLGADVGGAITGDELRARFDAIVLAIGAAKPRALDVPGADLPGVVYAMPFLTQQNRRVAGDLVPEEGALLATGKHVVVLGGGDTGSDCVGTSHRQGALSVTSLELMPAPPGERAPTNPWPEWPLVMRTSSSHEEGGTRDFAVQTRRVLAGPDGRIRALEVASVTLENGVICEIPGTEREIPCELLLLAMGFVAVSSPPLLAQLGLALTPRGTVAVTNGTTSVAGVFAAGDAVRGASLVVWAIAEGRKVADRVEEYLVRLAGEIRELG